MNTEALFLFLILLLGLVLCSFLGGNCGKEGMTGKFSGTFNTTDISNNTLANRNSSTSSTNNSSVNNSSGSNTFDNYNHFSGSSTSLTNGTTYYGQNGGSVVVSTDSNGKQTLQVTMTGNDTPVTFTSNNSTTSPAAIKPKSEGYTNYYGNNGSATTFYGPNNSTATVIYTNDGQQAINIQNSTGSYTFTQSGSTYNPNNTS
jgi:hypothetical protein